MIFSHKNCVLLCVLCTCMYCIGSVSALFLFVFICVLFHVRIHVLNALFQLRLASSFASALCVLVLVLFFIYLDERLLHVDEPINLYRHLPNQMSADSQLTYDIFILIYIFHPDKNQKQNKKGNHHIETKIHK